MGEEKPDPPATTLRALAVAAKEVSSVVREYRLFEGQRDTLPITLACGVEMIRAWEKLNVALHKLDVDKYAALLTLDGDKYRTAIWSGWPLALIDRVACIRAVHERRLQTVNSTEIERPADIELHPISPASVCVRAADVETLEWAASDILRIVAQELSSGDNKPANEPRPAILGGDGSWTPDYTLPAPLPSSNFVLMKIHNRLEAYLDKQNESLCRAIEDRDRWQHILDLVTQGLPTQQYVNSVKHLYVEPEPVIELGADVLLYVRCLDKLDGPMARLAEIAKLMAPLVGKENYTVEAAKQIVAYQNEGLTLLRESLVPFVITKIFIEQKLSATATEDSAAAARKEEPSQPKNYLMSWRDILDALERPNNDEERNRVRRLNDEYKGPIAIPKQGSQPKVEKANLLDWWNGLENRFAELQQRERDRIASVEDQHHYGRDGVVAPEISGCVKPRRRSTSNNVKKDRKTS